VRSGLAFAVALSFAFAPSAARADDEKEQCVAAHADSQKLRTESKLGEAREKLLICTRPECPSIVRSDCAKWLAAVQEEIPSIVVVATDANGDDVADVRILADGKEVATELTGQPVMLDPGMRQLRFERAGAAPIEQRLLMRVGERNRRVEVQFVPQLAGATTTQPGAESGGGESGSGAAEADSGGRTVPTLTWVLGGVGVAGLAGFTYFALDGSSRESDLDSCKPNCDHDDVQAARTSYLIGDISLGVGVLALAGATYFYLTAPTPTAAASARAPRVRVDVMPTSSGISGLVTGRF